MLCEVISKTLIFSQLKIIMSSVYLVRPLNIQSCISSVVRMSCNKTSKSKLVEGFLLFYFNGFDFLVLLYCFFSFLGGGDNLTYELLYGVRFICSAKNADRIILHLTCKFI